MKRIKEYIQEKLIVNNTILDHINYKYHPKDKDELIECIKDKIRQYGLGTKDNPLDLNDIDTSKITDMSYLFNNHIGPLKELSNKGNFDISVWDVSNVENMSSMFFNSNFTGENGDISDWDVSNVEDMCGMFEHSKFSGNIDKWKVKENTDMRYIFNRCPLKDNPPKWYKGK